LRRREAKAVLSLQRVALEDGIACEARGLLRLRDEKNDEFVPGG
jgi:hypothetical protein